MRRPRLPKSVAELVHWYERYISPIALVCGFIADNLFLTRRVDLLQTNVLLFTYLIVSACGIVLLNLLEAGRFSKPWILNIAPAVPLAIQFSFGGLFSGYLSLYSRSASFPLSWIFIAALVVFVLGNERFSRLYSRFVVQVGVYFTVLFSFLIFFLPVVFHQIGPFMFVAGGLVSLVVVAILLRILFYLLPEMRKKRTAVARTIAVIFVVFNALYFLGAIPPLPLALKDAGVYHSVMREADGSYETTGEPEVWYESFLPYNTVFHATPGSEVFVYSAVFAPSGLTINILHQWQRYDAASRNWVTTDTLEFPIQGGRDGGYRGYSIKTDITPGPWRVNVITQYGQLIGRIEFTVVSSTSTPALVQTSH